MTITTKPDVINPITLVNTPGAELAYIFEAHNIDNYNELLGIEDLSLKEHLSKKTIAQAAKILGMEGSLEGVITRHEARFKLHKAKSRVAYATALKQFAKLRPILPLLKDEYSEGEDRLNDLLDYFDADSPEDVFIHSESEAALYRKQNQTIPDAINLHGWLRRGEIDFGKMQLPPYDETGLCGWIDSRAWEAHLTDPDHFKRLPSVLAAFGVGLSLVPYLSKTVYGAIRWMDGRPLIEISDRDHDLAACWFTLFHEFGHAILHRNDEILEGTINESAKATSQKEKEANKFANGYLFNGDDLRKTVFGRIRDGITMTANALAAEFRVNSMFAAYWLRKARHFPEFQRRYNIDFTDDFQ